MFLSLTQEPISFFCREALTHTADEKVDLWDKHLAKVNGKREKAVRQFK